MTKSKSPPVSYTFKELTQVGSQATSKKPASTRNAKSPFRTSKATSSRSTAMYGVDRHCRHVGRGEAEIIVGFGQSRMNDAQAAEAGMVLWSLAIMRYLQSTGLDCRECWHGVGMRRGHSSDIFC